MKDFKLTMSSIGYFIQELWKLDLNKAWRVTIVQWRESRSLSQNAFQHVIYGEMSKFLIGKGRTDWTPKKTKLECKNTFLGYEFNENVNMVTGEITIRETLKHTSELDVGDSYHYTTQLLDFAQTIGCHIKIPAKCDYRDLQEQQNN